MIGVFIREKWVRFGYGDTEETEGSAPCEDEGRDGKKQPKPGNARGCQQDRKQGDRHGPVLPHSLRKKPARLAAWCPAYPAVESKLLLF